MCTKKNDFINDEKVREDFIDRVEVLDKVKGLISLPNTGLSTTNQVAEFYKVERNIINQIISRNRDEFENDGIMYKSGNEIVSMLNTAKVESINRKRNGIEVDGIHLAYSNNTMLPKISTLRISFLLKDSEIARNIKNDLLLKCPELYQYFLNFNQIDYKKYEDNMYAFLKALIGNDRIQRNFGYKDYYIDFLIDGYIAIEVDENGHIGYDKKQELIREGDILEKYKLLRFDARESNYLNFTRKLLNLL